MSVRAENLALERCEVTGKLRFSSQAKAHVHCQRVQKSNKRKGDRHPVHVYACQCGGFHVGHDTTFVSRKQGKYIDMRRK